MSKTLEEMKATVAGMRASKCTLGCGFESRFTPAFRHASDCESYQPDALQAERARADELQARLERQEASLARTLVADQKTIKALAERVERLEGERDAFKRQARYTYEHLERLQAAVRQAWAPARQAIYELGPDVEDALAPYCNAMDEVAFDPDVARAALALTEATGTCGSCGVPLEDHRPRATCGDPRPAAPTEATGYCIDHGPTTEPCGCKHAMRLMDVGGAAPTEAPARCPACGCKTLKCDGCHICDFGVENAPTAKEGT